MKNQISDLKNIHTLGVLFQIHNLNFQINIFIDYPYNIIKGNTISTVKKRIINNQLPVENN